MEVLEKADDVIEAIAGNDEMAEIYERVFPVVATFISSAGGSFEDAKDIFHDALVIYIEKITQDPLGIIKSDQAYILGIAKHLWIRKYRKEVRDTSLSDMENEFAIPDDYFATASNRRLLNFLKIAGRRCLDLLRAFYFQEMSIKEIAGQLGYSHEHSVSVQKYKCLEKVRNTVKTKSLTYDDFME